MQRLDGCRRVSNTWAGPALVATVVVQGEFVEVNCCTCSLGEISFTTLMSTCSLGQQMEPKATALTSYRVVYSMYPPSLVMPHIQKTNTWRIYTSVGSNKRNVSTKQQRYIRSGKFVRVRQQWGHEADGLTLKSSHSHQTAGSSLVFVTVHY